MHVKLAIPMELWFMLKIIVDYDLHGSTHVSNDVIILKNELINHI